jgi:hypothetical protein
MAYDNSYACTKEVAGSGARCRNNQPCPAHSADPTRWSAAATPTQIQFKIELPFEWRSVFSKVEVEFRDWSERQRRSTQHLLEAEKLGRSTNAFVGQIARTDVAPENFHSGCPVFGDTGGLDRVDISKLEQEIRNAGFVLVTVSILARPTGKVKKPDMLVLHLEKGAAENQFPSFPWDKFRELAATTMTYVHVWANGRQEDGTVVHTVNCVLQENLQHKKAGRTLHFVPDNEGYWVTEPITAAAGAHVKEAPAVA